MISVSSPKEIEHVDLLADLLSAAESSLDFWDNPLDDEDWNSVPPEGLISARKQTPPPATCQKQS